MSQSHVFSVGAGVQSSVNGFSPRKKLRITRTPDFIPSTAPPLVQENRSHPSEPHRPQFDQKIINPIIRSETIGLLPPPPPPPPSSSSSSHLLSSNTPKRMNEQIRSYRPSSQNMGHPSAQMDYHKPQHLESEPPNRPQIIIRHHPRALPGIGHPNFLTLQFRRFRIISA